MGYVFSNSSDKEEGDEEDPGRGVLLGELRDPGSVYTGC